MGRGSSKVGGSAVTRDFSANSADNFLNVRPVTGFSNYEERREIMRSTLQEALDQGYEVIPREYSHRGRSGQLYTYEESNIEVPVRTTGSGMLARSSNLVRHVRAVQDQYDDVIVLQVKPVTQTVSPRRGGGFNQGTPTAEYTVLARRRR